MRRPLFSVAAASMFLAGVGLVHAQSTTTTTTTWTNGDGTVIRNESTTHHYQSFSDPSWQPGVGAELPPSATLYPLPPTIHVPTPDLYSYSIINNEPVVVERSTRRVVHTWD
ncbi:MAG: DUF1236 domain-containing protein [Acetobacteraceae bacterium]